MNGEVCTDFQTGAEGTSRGRGRSVRNQVGKDSGRRAQISLVRAEEGIREMLEEGEWTQKLK